MLEYAGGTGRDVATIGRAAGAPAPLPSAQSGLQAGAGDARGGAGPGAGGGGGFGPIRAMQALWRARWRILFWGLLGAIALSLIAELLPPRYNASAQLLVDPRDLRVLDNDVSPRTPNTDTGIAVVETQARVLASDNVLRRTVAQLRLDQDPEFNGATRGAWGEFLALVQQRIRQYTGRTGPDADAQGAADLARQTLEQRVIVRRPERTFVLELTVWSENRQKAVAIAEAMVESYLADQRESRSEVALATGRSIDARLDELKEAVSRAEDRVQRYRAENNLVGASGRLVNEQQLTEVNNQLVLAQSEVGRARARFDEIQRARLTPENLPEAVASATLRSLRTQAASVAAESARLGTSLQPRHPAFQAIAQQQREIRRQIDQELARITAATRSELDRARAAEASLQRNLDDLRRQVTQSSASQITLRELDRDLEASRAIYQAALTRGREAREQASLSTLNVRVISPAVAHRSRAFPPRRAIVIPAGFLLGAGLAALAALAAAAAAAGAGANPPYPYPSQPASAPQLAPAANVASRPVRQEGVEAARRASTALPRGRQGDAESEAEAEAATRQDAPPAVPAVIPPAIPPAIIAARAAAAGPAPTKGEAGGATAGAAATTAATKNAFHAAAPLSLAAREPGERPFIVIDLRRVAASDDGQALTRGRGRLAAAIERALSLIDAPRSDYARRLSGLEAMLAAGHPSSSADAPAARARVVMVTSDQVNTDKPSIAMALAIAAAMRGQQVLLVDADLTRRPLSEAMGGSFTHGVMDVVDARIALEEAIVRLPETRISFLAASQASGPRGREVLTRKSLARLVGAAAQSYDVVVIDAPVLEEAHFQPDFADDADDVVVVMAVDPVSERSVVDGLETLRDALPRISSLVITPEQGDIGAKQRVAAASLPAQSPARAGDPKSGSTAPRKPGSDVAQPRRGTVRDRDGNERRV